jgi:hypothetical protein
MLTVLAIVDRAPIDESRHAVRKGRDQAAHPAAVQVPR